MGAGGPGRRISPKGVRWLKFTCGACGKDKPSGGFEEGLPDFGARVVKMTDCWRLRDAGTHTLSVVSATRACARTHRLSCVQEGAPFLATAVSAGERGL